MEGNEQVIGFNQLKDLAQGEEARRAFTKQEMILTGPVDLVQGGQGVIARLPVLIEDRWGGEDQFWGFTNTQLGISINHQSNGRGKPTSRSWNRAIGSAVLERDRMTLGLRAWYRIPESEKDDPSQPKGDDNPDINKFMGNFELTTIYQWDDQNISLKLRNNLRSDNHGAIQLDWSYPMGKRFKGYVQFFNGYGESLIDYNHSVQRFGIGVLLTDFF